LKPLANLEWNGISSALCRFDRVEKADEILSTAAADFNILNSDGQTVVHLLALANHFKLAKLICKKLPLLKMDLIDRNEYNPFIVAVVHGSLRMVDYFLHPSHD
jgi:ankyrin repeat protein